MTTAVGPGLVLGLGSVVTKAGERVKKGFLDFGGFRFLYRKRDFFRYTIIKKKKYR